MSVEEASALCMTKKKKHKHNKHDVQRQQQLKRLKNSKTVFKFDTFLKKAVLKIEVDRRLRSLHFEG